MQGVRRAGPSVSFPSWSLQVSILGAPLHPLLIQATLRLGCCCLRGWLVLRQVRGSLLGDSWGGLPMLTGPLEGKTDRSAMFRERPRDASLSGMFAKNIKSRVGETVLKGARNKGVRTEFSYLSAPFLCTTAKAA